MANADFRRTLKTGGPSVSASKTARLNGRAFWFMRGAIPNPLPTPMTSVEPDAGVLPVVLVLLSVLFNAMLAISNAHVVPLNMSVVAGCEFLIVLAAQVTAFRNYQAQMLPWYGMIAFIIAFAFLRGSYLESFEPKYIRDVILIPTFVLLGMTVPFHRVKTTVTVLHVIVVAGVLFEALFTSAYAGLFDVRGYYIATRAFDQTAFWDTTSDLFVSATRPEARFFNFINLHRVSSVFLEPVSLGNYVIVLTAFLCANFSKFSIRYRAFLLGGMVIALVGCDGRLAAICSTVIVLVTLVAPRLPPKIALLYLPASVIGAFILVFITHPDAYQDNFSGRVAYCVNLLANYDISDWLGLSDHFLAGASDSGIAYIIATQSVIGVALFWVLLNFEADEHWPNQVKFTQALCLYVALTMLVSYSLFSIKTAALLWFIHGSLQRREVRTSDPEARRHRRSRAVAGGWTDALAPQQP
jgi:putative polymerase